MRNNGDMYGHIYILDQEAKTKRFSQCPSVCPSIRLSVSPSAKLIYTKTHERKKDN